MGSGERVLLAGADVAQTACCEGDRLVAMTAEELRSGDGGLDAATHRGVGVFGESGRSIDVVDDLIEATERDGSVGPHQQQGRFAVGHGPETGQHTEHCSGLDRLGGRLRQRHQHPCCSVRGAGIEEESRGFDRPTTFRQRRCQPCCHRRLDLVGPVERSVEDVDVSGDLPAQGDAGFQRPGHEVRTAERSEQGVVDPWRPGEQADEDAIGGIEGLESRHAGAAGDVGDDADRIEGWLSSPLIDGGGDELDTAVGGLDHLVGDLSAELGNGVDDLVRGDRQRRRVEDQPVEQVGDFVKLFGEEPPGHRRSGRRSGRPRSARQGSACRRRRVAEHRR